MASTSVISTTAMNTRTVTQPPSESSTTMTTSNPLSTSTDRNYELVLERVVPVAPELVWAAWTQPEHITKWFTPAPWTTPEAEVDLRPGGIFRTVMRSPEGDQHDNSGCFLEVVENERLVWTGALGPGFRPNDFSEGGFPFTAVISLEPVDGGTKYTATAMHANAADHQVHEEMGFLEGWGAALDQLVEYMSSQ
jgi:uncharacterized protein YndB with AHSA1/START domain